MIARVLLTCLLLRIDALSTPLLVPIHRSVGVCGRGASEKCMPRNGAVFYPTIWVPEYSRDIFTTKIPRQKYM